MSKDQIESLGLEESAGYKNLVAIRDYATATRKLFRELQEENKIVNKQLQQRSTEIKQLKEQLTQMQIKIYSNKATT